MAISTINSSVNPPDILYYGTSSKYMYRIDNASVGDPPKTILLDLQQDQIHMSLILPLIHKMLMR